MARTESAILKLVDLSATKATPSAHGSQAAEGLLRFETETERGELWNRFAGPMVQGEVPRALKKGFKGPGTLK